MDENARFCPHCATPLGDGSSTPTRSIGREGSDTELAATSLDHGRFLPGTVLARRYRILGMLGKGGMGEVYRADDLKLGQAVALKFLPRAVAKEPARLSRFLAEARIARQISHTNVCRVYDAGEVDGHHFITMEYVDGEDLAALLKRIGRLPKDKAIQIARQLCAGLAAAHEQGVLHRDLKPSNVMIDGRGRARIADFGLAALAGDVRDVEARAGTPAYMAPEQLAGKAVSVRSDIYSLGLVLYELFTGRPAFKSPPFDGSMRRPRSESFPARPSSLVDGFDPAVERTILRCLEPEPDARPSSALAVAAALPGGDPLAAALAAGETPSPEMVAEATEVGGLSPGVAVTCLAGFVVAFLAVVGLSAQVQISRIISPEKPPEVLKERARELIRAAGQTASPVDSAYAYTWDPEFVDYLARNPRGAKTWDRLRGGPPALGFWYRQSPILLVPLNPTGGGAQYDDPPLNIRWWSPWHDAPGQSRVVLDHRGRLVAIDLVPPQRDASLGPWAEPDWDVLLREADLDRARLKSVPPIWWPGYAVDQRAAWEFTYEETPDLMFRVEEAAYHGQVVFLRIFAPWDHLASDNASTRGVAQTVSSVAVVILVLGVMIGGAFLARRNLRLGRGDRRSAIRLATFLFATQFISWLLGEHFVASFFQLLSFIAALAFCLLESCFCWIFYIALEPYLRRLWPRMIVSWVRLLNGRFRDPLVGRDVLIGLLVGAAAMLWDRLLFSGSAWLGVATPRPDHVASWWAELEALGGMRPAASALVNACGLNAVGIPLIWVVMLLLFRLILRKQWLAIAAFLVMCILTSRSFPSNWIDVAGAAVVYVVMLALLLRFGLVSLSAAWLVFSLGAFPISFDLSRWYAVNSLLAVAVIAALAVWSFRISLAGRPVFRDSVLEG